MAKPMQLGTAKAAAGEKARGYVEVMKRADGATLDLPMLIVNGSQPGPRLWLTSCHHGDEVGGAIAIFRIFEELDPRELRGSVAAIPVCNPTALRAKQRNSPIDNKDLERAFPGEPNGSYTERLAHGIHQLVLKNADFLVDLHGGLKDHKIIHQAYFDYFNPKVKDANRGLAEAMACDYVCGLPEREYWGGAGLECLCLGDKEIPSVLSETNDPELHCQDIRNLLAHLKMIPGEVKKKKKKKVYQRTLHLVSGTQSGIFIAAVDLYQRVSKGDLLGQIVDLTGSVVEEIRSPIENGIVTVMRRLPVVEAVWETTHQGTTFEAAVLFEVGELGTW